MIPNLFGSMISRGEATSCCMEVRVDYRREGAGEPIVFCRCIFWGRPFFGVKKNPGFQKSPSEFWHFQTENKGVFGTTTKRENDLRLKRLEIFWSQIWNLNF